MIITHDCRVDESRIVGFDSSACYLLKTINGQIHVSKALNHLWKNVKAQSSIGHYITEYMHNKTLHLLEKLTCCLTTGGELYQHIFPPTLIYKMNKFTAKY